MLRISRGSAEEHHRRVLEQTEGIAFMGTPHCGSHAADWAKVVTSVAKLVKGVNDSIIKALQPDSEVLERIQQDFHTMIRSRNEAGKYKIQITCFYEDLSIPGIGLVSGVDYQRESDAETKRSYRNTRQSYIRMWRCQFPATTET